MVRLWNIASGQVTILRGQEKRVSSVAFSRDGRFLASGSPWDLVKVWDVASGRLYSFFSADTPVYSVAFNHDGTALALGGGHRRDGTAQLRTPHAGTELDVVPGHAGIVESVAFSPDGNVLACGSEDHTIRLWDLVSQPRRHPDGPRGRRLVRGVQPARQHRGQWPYHRHNGPAVGRDHPGPHRHLPRPPARGGIGGVQP